MGFFNAAFRLGVIQGFQNRQEEIAEEQEKLLEDDKRVARKAISRIENVRAKRKQLDQNVNNMFELTKNIAKGANPDAYKNMLKQWALTHGSKINQSVAERLARKSVEEINAFMPVEEPAPESPPETEEEESGLGFLAAVFSPTARAAARREKIFQKPPGVSEEEWMAALADQDIPAYGEPSQPVATPEQIKDLQDFTLTDTNKAVALLATGFPDMTEREIKQYQTPEAKLFGTISSMLKKADRTFENNPLAREYNSGNITELPSDVSTLADLTNDDNVDNVLRSIKNIGVKETIKELQKKDASTSSSNTQSVDMVKITDELRKKITEKLTPAILASLTDQDRQALKQPEVPKSILDKIGI
jgi:hypothetical protein